MTSLSLGAIARLVGISRPILPLCSLASTRCRTTPSPLLIRAPSGSPRRTSTTRCMPKFVSKPACCGRCSTTSADSGGRPRRDHSTVPRRGFARRHRTSSGHRRQRCPSPTAKMAGQRVSVGRRVQNEEGCRTPCPQGRAHVCMICLQPHRNRACLETLDHQFILLRNPELHVTSEPEVEHSPKSDQSKNVQATFFEGVQKASGPLGLRESQGSGCLRSDSLLPVTSRSTTRRGVSRCSFLSRKRTAQSCSQLQLSAVHTTLWWRSSLFFVFISATRCRTIYTLPFEQQWTSGRPADPSTQSGRTVGRRARATEHDFDNQS